MVTVFTVLVTPPIVDLLVLVDVDFTYLSPLEVEVEVEEVGVAVEVLFEGAWSLTEPMVLVLGVESMVGRLLEWKSKTVSILLFWTLAAIPTYLKDVEKMLAR